MDFLDPAGVIASILIGLFAGLVGGLAGIGGSIIMLPALALWFGYQTPDHDEHHLYMASAMCVNAVVAYFSARKHKQHGALHAPTVRVVLPAMCVAIVAGVLVSNRLDGTIPKLALVAFILAYCVYSAIPDKKAPTPTRKPSAQAEGDSDDDLQPRPLRLSLVATITGFAAGFLGIGGGILLVPLLQVVGRLPLRRAIAASAAVMWITAIIGATLKLTTLSSLGLDWLDALALASLMAIGAVLGARSGATLTHTLKLPHLKIAIAIILAIAAVRMAASTWSEMRDGHSPEAQTTPASPES